MLKIKDGLFLLNTKRVNHKISGRFSHKVRDASHPLKQRFDKLTPKF